MQEKGNKTKTVGKYRMPSDFYVEIKKAFKEMSVNVYGVISIIELNDDSCLFKVRGGRIAVRGKNLSVSVFENNVLEVSGRIEGVDML